MKIYGKLLVLLIIIFSVSLVSARIQFPAYDSGWTNISQGEVKTFTHNISGDADNYLIDITANDFDGNGINQIAYGTRVVNGTYIGYYWRNLNLTSIQVYRPPQDTTADQVRVRIWDYTVGDSPPTPGALEGPYLYGLIEQNKQNITSLVEEVEQKIDVKTTQQYTLLGFSAFIFLFIFWFVFIKS